MEKILNKEILVSVIIPSYNHEKYITKSIEGVVNQTYNNIELIVIDDGSTDTSPKIIDKLAEQYKFTFIHRPNKGLSATLNECISLSSGKYICVCASDDIYLEDKIEKQVNFMESNQKYGMSYGKIILLKDDGIETPLTIKYSRSGWIFDDLVVNHFSIPAVTCMIRRSIITKLGGFDENLWVEDWDMWLRIANEIEIGYIDEYLAYYRKHETNISSNSWKMYEAKKDALLKWEKLDSYNKILKVWELKWFRALSKDYRDEARKYLPTALKNIFNKNSIIGLIKYFFTKKH